MRDHFVEWLANVHSETRSTDCIGKTWRFCKCSEVFLFGAFSDRLISWFSTILLPQPVFVMHWISKSIPSKPKCTSRVATLYCLTLQQQTRYHTMDRGAGLFLKLPFVIGRLNSKVNFRQSKTEKVPIIVDLLDQIPDSMYAGHDLDGSQKFQMASLKVDKWPQYYVWRKAHFFICLVLLGVPPAASFEPLRLACNGVYSESFPKSDMLH